MKRSINCLSDEDERPSKPKRAKCTNQADAHASSDDRSDPLPSAAAPESDPTDKAEVDLSSRAAYRDVPLVHGDNTNIRVLRILPEKTRGQITCELIVVPVRGQVTYTALSYVWGEVRYPRSIRLNDRLVAVRENLWQFLNQMHQECRIGYFWIDALCINQFDIQERNHQVKMMGEIYSTAEQVVVWLGPEPDLPRHERLLNTIWVVVCMPCSTYNPDRKLGECLQRLSANSYWKQTWTIQEFILAQRIEIRSGADTLDENILRQLYNFSSLLLDLRSEVDQFGRDFNLEWEPTATFYIRLRNTRRNRLDPARATEQAARISIAGSKKLTEGVITSSLRHLVTQFAETECGDPRDHVYALLSLVDPEELERGPLSPDYSKPKHELLLDLTRRSFDYWSLIDQSFIARPEAACHFMDEVSDWATLLRLKNPDAAQHWAMRVVTDGPLSPAIKARASMPCFDHRLSHLGRDSLPAIGTSGEVLRNREPMQPHLASELRRILEWCQ